MGHWSFACEPNAVCTYVSMCVCVCVCVCSKWGGSRLEDDGHRERRLARDWRVSSPCTEFPRCVDFSLCLLQAQNADVMSHVFASGTACGRFVPCNYVEIMSASL